MAHFYRNAVRQVVPETEQPGLAFCDRLGLMTETIARSARQIARNCEQSDGGSVLSVFMVQTIGRKDAALCPEQRTSCFGDLWHSSYGSKPARIAAVFCVAVTQNDAGESAITEDMNGASVTRPNLPESRCQIVRFTHNLGRRDLVREREFWGMTLTPPWAGEQTARRRAHGLLDEKPKASRQRK